MPPGILMYRWFAKTYNWTPEQVDELPLDVYDWLPAIEIADYEAMEAQRRAEEARNRPRGGRGR